MDINKNKSESSQHLSWNESDHLPYLKEGSSIFEHEDDEKMRKRHLICAACDHPVTNLSEKIEVRGRHDHAFRYFNDIVRLGCFRNAQGCIGVQIVSHGYSWFRGYAWQVQVCRHCYAQLGWKYMSEDDSFYGLIFNTLREEEQEEDNGDAP